MRAEAIEIEKKFSKWFAWVKGDNNTPTQYGKICRNIRLQDWGIQNIPWFQTIYEWESGEYCYGAYWDSFTWRLFRNYDWRWEEVHPESWTITDRGGLVELPKSKCRFLSYDKYIIILTETTKPYIFDTSTNTLVAWITEIDDSVYPFLGAQYMWFTFLAYKNKLYISEPIVVWSESKAISWNTSTSWTQQISYKTNITALVATLERLWIITDEFIEYIDPNTITNVWDVASIYSIRYAESQVIVNQESIVPVGSKLFFWAKGNKIRSIGYKQWVAQLQVSDLSDVPNVWIDDYIQEELDPDQSDMVWYFDKVYNEIRWLVRRKNKVKNDLQLTYSLSAEWFADCVWKPFWSIAIIGENIYAFDAYQNNKVYKENTWNTFDGKMIVGVYESHPIKLWLPNIDKFWRGWERSWRVNNQTRIVLEAFVDWKTVMIPKIIFEWKWILSNVGIASYPLAWQPVAWDIVDSQFLNTLNYVATAATMRAKGKALTFRLTFYGWDQNRVVDYFAPFVFSLWKYKLSDKT